MKKEIQDELNRISPGFPAREAGERPSLPDGYFDRMQDQVLERLKTVKKENRRVRLFRRWQRIAAVFLVGLGMFLIGRQIVWQGQSQAMDSGIDLTCAEALDYALEHPDDFIPLIETERGDVIMDELFPGTLFREWDDEALEQVLDDLSDESIDDLL